MKLMVRLTGTNPLLMHNDRLANPFDPIVREMKSIAGTKKTDAVLLALARLEFEGGLYMDGNGPCVPTWNVKKCFMNAGALSKLKQHVKRGFAPLEPYASLEYEGPRDVDAMWKSEQFADIRTVRVTTSRVNRCRPRFDEWALEFAADLADDVMNVDTFAGVAEKAGRLVGLGDYNERFGRFTVSIETLT